MQIVRLLKWVPEFGIEKVRSQICEESTVNFAMSVRPRGTVRLPLDRFSLNLIFKYFSKLSREFKFHENMTRMAVSLHEDPLLCIFAISRSVIHTVRNV